MLAEFPNVSNNVTTIGQMVVPPIVNATGVNVFAGLNWPPEQYHFLQLNSRTMMENMTLWASFTTTHQSSAMQVSTATLSGGSASIRKPDI